MLVLTRKSREQIQIGENVVITVLRVKGQSVRIGIEAPRDVRVLRTELPVLETTTDEDDQAATREIDTTQDRMKTKPRSAARLAMKNSHVKNSRSDTSIKNIGATAPNSPWKGAGAVGASPLKSKLAIRNTTAAELSGFSTTNRLLHMDFEPAAAALG